MGGGASCLAWGQHTVLSSNRAFDSNDHHEVMEYVWEGDEEDDVHEDFLYSALFKLSHIFELNESLKEEITAVVCHIAYTCLSEQCQAVSGWIEEHAYTKLNYGEILNLIKYVELYEPPLLSEEEFYNEASQEKVESRDYSHLDCPFRCDIADWSAEIKRQRLSKIISQCQSSDTERVGISRCPAKISSLF